MGNGEAGRRRVPRGAWDASLIMLGVLADQATKFLMRGHFPAPGWSRAVIPGFFSLTYVRNTGAAWGVLAGWRVVLVALAVAMLVVLGRYRSRLFGQGALGRPSFILLAAGIAGNAIDRAFLGYVVDFLDFYVGASHFPAFNVADSCICVGVGLYMLNSFLVSRS